MISLAKGAGRVRRAILATALVTAATAAAAGTGQLRRPPGPSSAAVITVAEPTGKIVPVGEVETGAPVFVRRTTGKEGITVVEASTTPFAPDVAGPVQMAQVQRPDQPAGW